MSISQKILTEVLKKIKPSEQESRRVKELSRKALEIASQEAKKLGGRAIIAGSLPRDTWLVEKNEFDVFTIFPKALSTEQMEKRGLEIGKTVINKLGGKWRVDYAQHPYVTGMVGGIEVDVVPCYEIKPGEKIVSAVDRTPLHVEYLDKHLPKQLRDDVLLLKQFLKANGIYGADAKTEGFSGYLCELLVISYGKFIDILKAAVEWKPQYIVDIKQYWKKEDYKHLKKKFKDEVLIVIDPVDRDRNVASPISAETFYKFKQIVNDFLKRPSPKLFFVREVKPLTPKEFDKHMKNRETDLLAVVFKPPKVVPDILWPQLRKTTKRLESILREYEFFPLRSECWTDEKTLAIILLEMQVSCLPSIDKRIGPWVLDEKNAMNFIKKHKKAVTGPFIEDNFWVVEVKRKWTSAEEKLVDSLKETKKILEAKGIPNYIAEQISKGFKVVEERGIKKLMKNKEFSVFLRNYFEKERLAIE